MASSVLISIPEYLNFTNQNQYSIDTKQLTINISINKENKCLCDVCQGYATVLDLDNYIYNPFKICKKKSKSLQKIETQFNYTNYPNYSISNLEELSLKSINPLILSLPLTKKEKKEDEELLKLTSSNLTSPSLISSLSFDSFDSFRSSPDLFQELLCLECGNAEYCECFTNKYSQYDLPIPKKMEEDKLKEKQPTKLYEYQYNLNFYDEKKDCDCNLICYDSDCDCHFYEV